MLECFQWRKSIISIKPLCATKRERKRGERAKGGQEKKYKLLVGDFFKKIRFLIYGVHYSGGKTNSVIIDYIRAALKAT